MLKRFECFAYWRVPFAAESILKRNHYIIITGVALRMAIIMEKPILSLNIRTRLPISHGAVYAIQPDAILPQDMLIFFRLCWPCCRCCYEFNNFHSTAILKDMAEMLFAPVRCIRHTSRPAAKRLRPEFMPGSSQFHLSCGKQSDCFDVWDNHSPGEREKRREASKALVWVCRFSKLLWLLQRCHRSCSIKRALLNKASFRVVWIRRGESTVHG